MRPLFLASLVLASIVSTHASLLLHSVFNQTQLDALTSSLGSLLDTNHDGVIHRDELAAALSDAKTRSLVPNATTISTDLTTALLNGSDSVSISEMSSRVSTWLASLNASSLSAPPALDDWSAKQATLNLIAEVRSIRCPVRSKGVSWSDVQSAVRSDVSSLFECPASENPTPSGSSKSSVHLEKRSLSGGHHLHKRIFLNLMVAAWNALLVVGYGIIALIVWASMVLVPVGIAFALIWFIFYLIDNWNK